VSDKQKFSFPHVEEVTVGNFVSPAGNNMIPDFGPLHIRSTISKKIEKTPDKTHAR
jgi:hypothetical protein